MLKKSIKAKGAVFICQITENFLRVIKCLTAHNSKRQFVGLEAEAIAQDTDDKRLTEKLAQLFKKLGYSNNPLIVSLPRSKVTCRYLKVPTQIPEEIEKIASLQAPRYLPYPSEELITGYQIVFTDKEGYAQVNLVIVHKDVVERYIRILRTLVTTKITIGLSSYGLVNFFNYLKPEESQSVMLIDIDWQQAELAIVSERKLLFSRYFKFDASQPLWENLFIDEVTKTQDAYLKEVARKAPSKIMVTGAGKIYPGFAEALHKQLDLPVEVLPYEKINLTNELLDKILISEHSFAGIIGLGLKNVEENLNLLPQELKEKNKILVQHKKRLRLALLISGIILILFLGIAKNLDNKSQYLQQLNLELSKVAKDAKVLEEIEKRLEFMQQRSAKKLSGVDLLYELHRVIPSQISLVNLSYEEDNQVILRGQTPELNSVFAFVAQLGKSLVFKEFNIKVRYATQKKTITGEVVDFEVVCAKK